jgi:hypothetical protein
MSGATIYHPGGALLIALILGPLGLLRSITAIRVRHGLFWLSGAVLLGVTAVRIHDGLRSTPRKLGERMMVAVGVMSIYGAPWPLLWQRFRSCWPSRPITRVRA